MLSLPRKPFPPTSVILALPFAVAIAATEIIDRPKSNPPAIAADHGLIGDPASAIIVGEVCQFLADKTGLAWNNLALGSSRLGDKEAQ